jgi:hypothetical protein
MSLWILAMSTDRLPVSVSTPLAPWRTSQASFEMDARFSAIWTDVLDCSSVADVIWVLIPLM